MGSVWHVGRKAIIEYLRPYLDLSDDFTVAWRKVRRWRINYGLPILHQPNTIPYIDPEEFVMWWKTYLKKRKAQQVGKNQSA